jgi:hypothetical protein
MPPQSIPRENNEYILGWMPMQWTLPLYTLPSKWRRWRIPIDECHFLFGMEGWSCCCTLLYPSQLTSLGLRDSVVCQTQYRNHLMPQWRIPAETADFQPWRPNRKRQGQEILNGMDWFFNIDSYRCNMHVPWSLGWIAEQLGCACGWHSFSLLPWCPQDGVDELRDTPRGKNKPRPLASSSRRQPQRILGGFGHGLGGSLWYCRTKSVEVPTFGIAWYSRCSWREILHVALEYWNMLKAVVKPMEELGEWLWPLQRWRREAKRRKEWTSVRISRKCSCLSVCAGTV